MSETIPYDVSDVLPFPLGKDTEIDGMHAKRKRRKRRPPLPPELERYRLYTEDDLDEVPPVTWLIERHLALGELTVFYGKGDTYKSFLALDWSCWLSHHGVLVVYIVSEGASGVRARVAAWKKHHRVSTLPNLRLMPANINLHDSANVEDWLAAVSTQLGERTPGLVVVDTLARNFVGGNESSPQDMGMFVEGLEVVRRQLRTAVLVIHHETKEGGTERGTESLRNASFAMFRFVRVNNVRLVKVKCDRMKDAEPPPERRIRPEKIALPELGENVSSLVAGWSYSANEVARTEAELSGESSGEISPDSRRLLAAFDRESLRESGAPPGELARILQISRSTLNVRVKPLLERGLLTRKGETTNLRYFRTDKPL